MIRAKQGHGIWELTSPFDLLTKLRHDRDRMIADFRNPFPAYDFFVTAYHMYEWVTDDPAVQKQLEATPLVRVAGEIATRAKHHRPTQQKWIALKTAQESFGRGPHSQTPLRLPMPLRVVLQDPLPPQITTKEIAAIELARVLIEFWQDWLNKNPVQR